MDLGTLDAALLFVAWKLQGCLKGRVLEYLHTARANPSNTFAKMRLTKGKFFPEMIARPALRSTPLSLNPMTVVMKKHHLKIYPRASLNGHNSYNFAASFKSFMIYASN